MGRRGFVLLMSLGVVVFFSLAVVAILVRGLWQSTASARLYNRSSALQLADAAVDQAARNLMTSDPADDVTTATLAAGSFQIDPPQTVTATISRVTARGTSGSEQRRIEAIFQLTPQSIFQFALFGQSNVSVSGSAITDSYNSALGAYNATPGPGYNAGHDGDVGTNATAAGGVNVSGSIFVDGQVAVGYGVSNPQSVVSGYNPAFITGGTSPPTDTQDVVSQGSAFPMPAVTVPSGLTCNNFTVSGNTTVTLSSTGGPNGNGTYCYKDLNINGGGTLTANGPVSIYITGNFTASGNSTMGVPSSPKQMLVQMTSTAGGTIEKGTLSGSTRFYGALYAPQSPITISGNADVYGSIIAQSISLTGSASIHYDQALNTLPQVSNSYKTTRIAWREL